MKKFICLTIIGGVLLSNSLFVNALSINEKQTTKSEVSQESNKIASDSLGMISAKLDGDVKISDIKDTKDIDKSKLKSFTSEEDALAYVKKEAQSLVNATNSKSLNKFICNFAYNGYRHTQKSLGFGVTAYMNVDYTAKWSSSKRRNYYASSSKPTTGITGFTLWNSWDHCGGGSSISDDGQKLTAYASGNLNMHILLNGLPKAFSQRVELNGSWGRP
ncbi:hypothetical protein [Clostridium chrysemydis]|uniref:hypothetical protein n=1 Tax=Clostridium chrysemydis TaxID=2665504 RepID=UPI0018847254|nr:hypothetical protein [Clostridium chrysemydis]